MAPYRTSAAVQAAKIRLADAIEKYAEEVFDANVVQMENTSGSTLVEIRCTDGVRLNVTITEKRTQKS